MSVSPAPSHLHLVTQSTFDELEHIVDRTQAFVQQLDDEDAAYNVVLLVSEAVTNAIEHGNSLDETKRVTLDVWLHPDNVEIVVEDEGAGFKPEQVADPLKQENLYENHGRGLFLMESLASEVRYEEDGRRIRIQLARST